VVPVTAVAGEAFEPPEVAIEVSPNPISLAADPGTVWVGHAGGEITPIDIATLRAGPPIDAGGSVTGLAVTASSVWASNNLAGEVIEISERTVVSRTSVPDGAVRIAASDNDIWVTGSESSVTRLDAVSLSLDPAVEVGEGPIGVAVAGGLVWLANSDSGSVSRIEPRSARVMALEVGGAPVAVVAGLGWIWIVSQETDTLTRIAPVSGEVDDSPIVLGTNPRGIAVDEEAVWVVGTNPSRLIRLVV
jgi:hypothetical protein